MVPGRHRWLDALRSQLAEYFGARRQEFDLPLVVRGTPFQEKVWRALLTIPCGETWSYRQLAARVGQPRASRAVASIVKTGDKLIATEPCWNCKRTVRIEANNPFRIQCSVESMAGTNHFVRAVFMTEHAEWKRK